MGSSDWGKEKAQTLLNQIPLSSLWNQHLHQFSAAAGRLRWAGSCRSECRPACGTAQLPGCPQSSAPASSRPRFSYAPARLCGGGKRSPSNFAAKPARPKSQTLTDPPLKGYKPGRWISLQSTGTSRRCWSPAWNPRKALTQQPELNNLPDGAWGTGTLLPGFWDNQHQSLHSLSILFSELLATASF